MTDHKYIQRGIEYRILRRVQRDKMQDIARGIDRKADLIPATEKINVVLQHKQQNLENRWERVANRIEHLIYRKLVDKPTWCNIHKGIRISECDCE